jgi:O-6-methylguanine DNA methyltransferase
MMTREVAIVSVPTAFGAFDAVLSEAGVCCLRFPNEPGSARDWLRRVLPDARPRTGDARARILGSELDAYLRGELTAFSVPVDMRGTAFQRSVWRALLAIPHGEVRSYADVAAELGRPAAVRAVGAANGANPVPVIVPCHRVIGSSGKLVGFGAGLEWKLRLLAIENPARWAGGDRFERPFRNSP